MRAAQVEFWQVQNHQVDLEVKATCEARRFSVDVFQLLSKVYRAYV